MDYLKDQLAVFNCDPILENHTFGQMKNLWEYSIEIFNDFLKLTFLHILIKQLSSLLATPIASLF